MDIRYIIVILLILLINGYIINRTKEQFELGMNNSINFAVNNYYKADIDPLRNFVGISNKILNEETFHLPATDTIVKNLNISNDMTVKNNLKIRNKLKVDGDITFTNRNSTAYLDILPKWTIIGWSLEITDTIKAPKGWAVCDGKKYSLDENNYAFEDDYYGVETIDLRGRAIIGAGKGEVKNSSGDVVSYLTERKIKDIGGEEKHALTEAEIPSHTHMTWGEDNTGGWDGSFYAWESLDQRGLLNSSAYTETAGRSEPHNNMPPYCALIYIIKL